MSGVPILWDWDKASIEGLVWYPKNKGKGKQPDKAVAVGIVIEDIRLDKLMEKIFGDNLFKTAWFSEMVAGMYIEFPLLFFWFSNEYSILKYKCVQRYMIQHGKKHKLN